MKNQGLSRLNLSRPNGERRFTREEKAKWVVDLDGFRSRSNGRGPRRKYDWRPVGSIFLLMVSLRV